MGFIVKAVKSVFKSVSKIVGGVLGFATKLIGGIFGFGVKQPKAQASNVNNLNKSIDPEAPRKIVFGKIAAPLDVRFWEVWGNNNANNFDEIIAHAGHQIHSFQELYVEDKLAINAAGVVQTGFTGVLTRATKLGAPGQTALTAGSGSLWTSTATMTGVAHSRLAWVVDEKKLPNGIPSRYTQVIEGALVYDPRRDSTRGGSGTHRANDQSTWAYATLDGNGQPIGRNNALQALWYLLGWRVQNPSTGEWILVCGRGVDPEDINFASFIAGANACEVAGYYTDMNLSTEDEHTSNEDKITCSGLIGRLLDPGGLWSYYANVNDTANIAVTLTDADIIDGTNIRWQEYKGMSEQFNQVVGKFILPSSPVLYQPFAYPMVRDATYEANLGKKIRRTQDFPQVLDGVLAQRLARLKLNANQFQGELQAKWNMRAIKAQAWSVIRYQSNRFGWDKLFRVWRHEIEPMSGVTLLLREINSSIWTAGSTSSSQPIASGNNTMVAPSVTNLTATAISITSAGSPAIIQDGFSVQFDVPASNVDRTEIRYKLTGDTIYSYLAPITRGTTNAAIIFPAVKGTNYTIEARHITDQNQEGAWATLTITAGNYGNIVTANATVISKIDATTGRITDPRFFDTRGLLGISNTTNLSITYTVGGSNVTVNIPAHTRKIATPTGPQTNNYASGSIVVPFSSYWIAYVVDAGLDGEASPTYVYTTDPNELLYPNRYFVASGTSPASGGGGGSSGGGGGGGGGFDGSCVDAESFMPNGILAKQIMAGDIIEILDYFDFKGYCNGEVERNSIVRADCVRLISESGISVVCSKNSPCTLFGGKTIAAEDILGHYLAVRDNAGFRWEQIVKVENVGERRVAHIFCNQGTYAAGEQPNKFIYTHNPKP